MFQGKMVTPAIPERVFTLCKIVEKKPLSVSDLRGKMEPDYLQQSTLYYSDYRTAAEELKLIKISDNMVSLAVDPKVVQTTASMRAYVNSILEEFQDGQFYKVTKAYFGLGREILNGEQSVSDMAPKMAELTGEKVDAMAMRGWRFWASFLGFGFLQDMFLIPNPAVYLKDQISSIRLEQGKRYSFEEFIGLLHPHCGILLPDDHTDRVLSYGLSSGLRTLHDSRIIKLEHIMDQGNVWTLDRNDAHSIRDTVTDITIC